MIRIKRVCVTRPERRTAGHRVARYRKLWQAPRSLSKPGSSQIDPWNLGGTL
jgi:hypothetical protein